MITRRGFLAGLVGALVVPRVLFDAGKAPASITAESAARTGSLGSITGVPILVSEMHLCDGELNFTYLSEQLLDQVRVENDIKSLA